MAAGLVSHNITTASGVTFAVLSWVPDTTAPDVGAVPVARITDGTTVASFGIGTAATALRVNYANDGNVITVAQGGSAWTIGISGAVTLNPLPAGTAHIGEVAIDPTQLGTLGQTTSALSVPVVQANDYGMPLATDKMFAGTTALTPTPVAIDVAASGANTIVAGITSKKIRVVSLYLNASAAVNARWKSAGNNKTGISYLATAGDGLVLDFNPIGWFETNAGEALVLDLSAAITVGGCLSYIAV